MLSLFSLFAVATAASSEREYQALFTKFVSEHGKTYESEQLLTRYTIFKKNVDHINYENSLNHSYTLGINKFADLTGSEFSATYKGYNRDVNRVRNEAPLRNAVQLPTSVDWLAAGAVTPVKDQGQCGSCWAFSTTGSVEGAHQLATGSLVSLSEQQLVDCAGAQGNMGCNGGLMDWGFGYIIKNGICAESAYPYKAVDQSCQASSCPVVTRITGFTDVRQGDESALFTAVALTPVSIAIEADTATFQFYTGGVLDNPACGTQLDHGVLAVGWGNDPTSGKQYWSVKNSWGTGWGEKGYIRMVTNKNQCGIASEPSYATGASN